MKKYYLIIVIVIPFLLMAQPVIDNTWQPSIGDSYSFNQVLEPFDFPTSGANQVWDYSNINLGAVSTRDMIDPSTTPFAADFPNSNIVLHDPSNSIYFYFEKSLTQFLDWGMGHSQANAIYSDPLVYMPLPITYGDNVSDNATGTVSGGMGTGTRTVNTTIEGYGYGDLILPESTLNNVLCVKVLKTGTDDYGGGNVLTSSGESYLFLSPDETYVVFTLNKYVEFNDTVKYGSIKSSHVGLNDEVITDEIKTSVFPNPVNQGEGINISILVDKNQNVDVEIIDVTGKTIRNIGSKFLTMGTNSFTVESVDLDSGIYFVKTSTIDNSYGSTSKVIIK